MRVVFLTHNYPRHAGDVAGAFLHPLAVALRNRGVDLTVIAPSDRGEDGNGELDGVPVRRVRYALATHETLAYTGTMTNALRSLRGLRAFNGMVAAFRREVDAERRADPRTVVHAHWWTPAGMALPRGVPSVITCHGTDVRLLRSVIPARWIARRVLRRAGVVTTVSRALARELERATGITVPEEQAQAMPIPAVERAPSRGGGGVVVLGRLTDQKRVELAIEALALLAERGRSLTMTIAGEGAARVRLEQLVATRRLGEQVRFLGAITPDQVPEFLETADVMLMPALQEGMGLAAAEALIQGVPVVACRDGGGLLEVVPASAGGRVVAPEPAALAEAVASVVDDPASRDAAWVAGRAWQHRLSPDHVAERFHGWYERVLAA